VSSVATQHARIADVPPDRVRTELGELSAKYRIMRKLRLAQADDHDAGRDHHPDREELKAFAARWPGALSEIDRLPMDALHARLAEVDALLARADVAIDDLPTWVRGWIGVHRGLRGALAVKAWLHGRRSIDDAMRRALDDAMPTLRFPDDARLWSDALEVVAAPPRGRLVDVVLTRVATELDVDPHALRRTLWPPHPDKH
jgi:hypothetical protein